jgi:hypothetical protein
MLKTKTFFKKALELPNKFVQLTIFVTVSLSSTFAFAAMPTVEANEDGVDGTGGFFEFLSGWVKDILVWAPLGLMSAATLWVAWSLLVKVLAERQLERPNWGGVFAHAAGCILLLVVTVYLGNQTISVWA